MFGERKRLQKYRVVDKFHKSTGNCIFKGSMGNCTVNIEIDKTESGGTFTNYDTISGTVKLNVTGSISLNYIQVKLEGLSKSELSIPREPNGKKERKDKVLQDIHKVLYDTLIVFPPENVRQVSNAKEFSLTPGTYTYPFRFKIPLNNSCIKLLGITNKVLFNVKKLDLKINNGNFNTAAVRNMANNFINGSPASNNQQAFAQTYHLTNQLPPSLSGLGDFASIKYFVKVTCKRSSFLKVNLRAFDPFVFLPLDLNSQNEPLMDFGDFEEYREVFVRKEMVFKNRIPEIVGMKVPNSEKALPYAPIQPQQKKGFLQKFFETPTPSGLNKPVPLPPRPSRKNSLPVVNVSDVPFAFEVRFRHPAFLIPTKPPSFKLFLVSNIKPSVYSLAEFGKPDESNGLGVVYLQRLIVELTSTTIISVLETDGSINEIHKSKHDDVITVCNNTYENLKFDLFNCRKLKSSSATSNTNNPNKVFELEIPRKYLTNCVLPDYLSPSFKTCNIQRKYKLTVVGGFSSEKIVDFNNQAEATKKIRYVDLQINEIKVLGGLAMTSTLQTSATSTDPSLHSKTSLASVNGSTNSGITGATSAGVNISSDQLERPPKLPTRTTETSKASANSSADSLPLPTYDDVMREASYQNDSDHRRARRRYQQHEHYYNNLE